MHSTSCLVSMVRLVFGPSLSSSVVDYKWEYNPVSLSWNDQFALKVVEWMRAMLLSCPSISDEAALLSHQSLLLSLAALWQSTKCEIPRLNIKWVVNTKPALMIWVVLSRCVDTASWLTFQTMWPLQSIVMVCIVASSIYNVYWRVPWVIHSIIPDLPYSKHWPSSEPREDSLIMARLECQLLYTRELINTH